VRKCQRHVLLGALVAVLLTTFWGVGAQQDPVPAARAGGPGARGASGPPEPAPTLADGTPNLGRLPGEKGVWSVPYITNMGERVVEADGSTAVERRMAQGRGGRGFGRGDVPLGGG